MDIEFKKLIEQMPQLLSNLKKKKPLEMNNLDGIPTHGVYVFYEKNKPIYVGRSNRLKSRIREHYRESSTHDSATFAFNLAKEEMGINQRTPITRKELEKAPGFDRAFYEARLRVKEMEVRVVQIDDQATQALFEIYAVLALKTRRYNNFRTH